MLFSVVDILVLDITHAIIHLPRAKGLKIYFLFCWKDLESDDSYFVMNDDNYVALNKIEGVIIWV